MAGTFKEAISTTRQDFERHIAPIFRALWPDSEIFCVEDQEDPLLQAFDTDCGIDYLIQHKKQHKLRALASRIQRAEYSFDTFTVRYSRDSGTPTEYTKRINAIAGGEMYPVLTFHAYLSTDGNEFYGMAIINTVDLFEYLQKNPKEIKRTGADEIGQAEFLIARWNRLIEKYNVRIIKPTEDGYRMTYRTLKNQKEYFFRRPDL